MGLENRNSFGRSQEMEGDLGEVGSDKGSRRAAASMTISTEVWFTLELFTTVSCYFHLQRALVLHMCLLQPSAFPYDLHSRSIAVHPKGLAMRRELLQES